VPAVELDPEVLGVAVSRQSVLEALAEEPHHRQELQDELDLSKTTCHRIVRTFEDHDLLRRTDRGYALSTLGKHVARAVADYDETVRAAYRLEPLLDAVADEPIELPLEAFADANVTRPSADDPMRPVDRACELYFGTESTTIRTLDRSQFIPSVFIDEVFEAGIENELVGEFIFPPDVARERIEDTERFHRRMPEVEAAVQYRIYNAPPFGMTLYDEYVELRAYDEAGSPVLVIDTGDPAAVSWAEEVYAHYRERADPPETVDALPDWLHDPDVEF